jgi:hypothetical protein
MKLVSKLAVCAVAFAIIAAAPVAMAQSWEFGGGVGGGFYPSQTVSGAAGSASANLATNIAGSAWVDNSGAGHWGGELRYDYQIGALQLNGGGTFASFAAYSQAFHYDVLWYPSRNGSRIRPFLAAGAGVKIYKGTGARAAYQPLNQVALLTQAQDLTPMASVGGGVKIQLAARVSLRIELHDYLTPFPKQVITPNAGEKVSGWGWMQDFVPMVGISYTSAGR